MKSIGKFLILIIVIYFAFTTFKLKKTERVIKGGELKVEFTKKPVKRLQELAMASQKIETRIDTSYVTIEGGSPEIFGFTIPWTFGEEEVESHLSYFQKFQAKAGYKNVVIYRSDSIYIVEGKGPEILSFTFLKDSIVSEKGNFSKTGTSYLEERQREIALQKIREDSLFTVSGKNLRRYISEMIKGISGKENNTIRFNTSK